MSQTPKIAHHHAEAVIQRYGNADARSRFDAGSLADKESVVDEVVMGERGPLRQAGCAACELDVDRRVGVNGRGHRVEQLPGGLVRQARYDCERLAACVRLVANRYDVPQGWQSGAAQHILVLSQLGCERVEHREVVARLEAGGRDERTALDRAQRMLEFDHPVGGIDVDQNQSGFSSRKLRHGPLRAVGGPDAYALARLEAEAQQARRELVGASLELGIGPPHTLVRNHERQSCAFAFRDSVEIRSDRLLNQRSGAVPPDIALLLHYLPSNVISGGGRFASKA